MFKPIYIASKGSRPKKGATRRTPPPIAKRKTAWWLWLLIPAILLAFIYGLMQLSQIAPEAAKASAAKPSKPAPQPKTVEKAKPVKKPAEQTTAKKDNFEFYQILQDSEVDTSHVDAYQSTPRGEQDFYYMLQAASFRSSDDADRLRAKLILSGLVEASIRKTIGKDGRPWYRVILGPYISRSKMNRAEDKLVSMDISSFSYKVKKEP